MIVFYIFGLYLFFASNSLKDTSIKVEPSLI